MTGSFCQRLLFRLIGSQINSKYSTFRWLNTPLIKVTNQFSLKNFQIFLKNHHSHKVWKSRCRLINHSSITTFPGLKNKLLKAKKKKNSEFIDVGEKDINVNISRPVIHKNKSGVIIFIVLTVITTFYFMLPLIQQLNCTLLK